MVFYENWLIYTPEADWAIDSQVYYNRTSMQYMMQLGVGNPDIGFMEQDPRAEQRAFIQFRERMSEEEVQAMYPLSVMQPALGSPSEHLRNMQEGNVGYFGEYGNLRRGWSLDDPPDEINLYVSTSEEEEDEDDYDSQDLWAPEPDDDSMWEVD